MHKRQSILHFLFWVFIFVFFYGTQNIQTFELLEFTGCIIFFYLNYYILIPNLLIKHGGLYYFISLAILILIVDLFLIATNAHEYYYPDYTQIGYIIEVSLCLLLFAKFSFLYWYLILYQEEKRKLLLVQNEKLKAELQFLKSQVSPHFLFNSLNNIYSLSVTKHDNAPVMIAKLSDILRYIIYEGNSKNVPLLREVELLENYIELQLLKKLKAEKKIQWSFSGVERHHKIAPLILINLVENCFKHSNVAYTPTGFLEIDLNIHEDELMFSTKNTFNINNKQSGIGLDNIKKQLGHYYPDKFNFHIENENGVFSVNLQIELT